MSVAALYDNRQMIRAIIFDLDGTLADTEPLHFAAFKEVLSQEGIELTEEEYYKHLIGYTDHDCFAAVLKDRGHKADDAAVVDLARRKAMSYQRMIADRDLLYPGAVDFVNRCAARGPIAVATGTLRDEAELILTGPGLRKLFAEVVAAEDVEHGKPAPDIFLATLKRLNSTMSPPLKAEECLVLEDTGAGIEAARSAGMKVLALKHSAPAEELALAHAVRKSLLDIDLDEILRTL